MRNIETVGQFLRRRRDSLGLTLQSVATFANCSVSFLSDIERDHRTFSPSTLVDLARALRIKPDDLAQLVSEQQTRTLREKVAEEAQ